MENIKIRNTDVIETLLQTMSYVGVWRPTFLTSLWTIRIYTLYSFIVILNLLFFSMTFIIILYQNKDRPDVFTENIFISTSLCLLAFKVIYFNIHRNDVINLLNLLLQNNCTHFGNSKEIEIYRKFQIKGRFIARLFLASSLFFSTVYLIWPLRKGEAITLPLKRWLPYSIVSRKAFWMTYIFECISVYYGAFTYSSFESLLANFMQQICAQLDILTERLFQITKIRNNINEKVDIYKEECKFVRECVNHHVCIFLMEKKLNDIFGFLVFTQFFFTTFNLCTCGFHLTKITSNDAYFWFFCMLIWCFIFQIFTQCYFGDEMTNKSLSIVDKICQMDWDLLSLQTKKKLIFIMIRASYPIQLTGASLIVFSIETFCKIIKASYSSFSLLKKTN